MIISVHLPKTAGASFRSSLLQHFGDRLHLDYGDTPLNVDISSRNKKSINDALLHVQQDWSRVECIHGHFLPVKYLLMAPRSGGRFITWMRNPVDRLISHYYYWQQLRSPPSSAAVLRKRMLDENWTLERFCLGEEMRNTYAQFLWGFPLGYFEFIGITEHYSEDLAYFSKAVLNSEHGLVEQQLNRGTHSSRRTPIDAELRHRIEEWHSIDMRIYQKALMLRWQRTSGFAPKNSDADAKP